MIGAFVEALRNGDRAASQKLVTPELAKALELEPAAGLAPPPPGQRDIKHEIRAVRVAGATAHATVWLQNPALRGFERELLLTVTLARVGEAWRIAELDLKPFLKELHEEEVPQ